MTILHYEEETRAGFKGKEDPARIILTVVGQISIHSMGVASKHKHGSVAKSQILLDIF